MAAVALLGTLGLTAPLQMPALPALVARRARTVELWREPQERALASVPLLSLGPLAPLAWAAPPAPTMPHARTGARRTVQLGRVDASVLQALAVPTVKLLWLARQARVARRARTGGAQPGPQALVDAPVLVLATLDPSARTPAPVPLGLMVMPARTVATPMVLQEDVVALAPPITLAIFARSTLVPGLSLLPTRRCRAALPGRWRAPTK